jgi:uncharacterized protein (DUF1697 family)
MSAYISFLRGVNMAGHNSIKMNDLAQLYKQLGYNNVSTFIQSGNVIFSSSPGLSEGEISSGIEEAIAREFNYIIPVMLRTIDEMKNIISVNPFLSEEHFDPSKMAVIFLHDKPSEDQLRKVKNIDYPPDKFFISGREIFIYCPNGFGRTKLYTNFFEKKMDVTGTGRNWNTFTTILSLAEQI